MKNTDSQTADENTPDAVILKEYRTSLLSLLEKATNPERDLEAAKEALRESLSFVKNCEDINTNFDSSRDERFALLYDEVAQRLWDKGGECYKAFKHFPCSTLWKAIFALRGASAEYNRIKILLRDRSKQAKEIKKPLPVFALFSKVENGGSFGD